MESILYEAHLLLSWIDVQGKTSLQTYSNSLQTLTNVYVMIKDIH